MYNHVLCHETCTDTDAGVHGVHVHQHIHALATFVMSVMCLQSTMAVKIPAFEVSKLGTV